MVIIEELTGEEDKVTKDGAKFVEVVRAVGECGGPGAEVIGEEVVR